MGWRGMRDRWREYDPVALTAELVALPTYGEELGVEDAAIRHLARRFERRGIPFRVRYTAGGRAFNVTARVGEGAPVLLFNGHLDVVPPGDEAAWSSPPFQPRIEGDRLYGRGSCDAKASIACMVVALERLWDEGIPPHGSVVLAAVGGEERGGTGVRYELEAGLHARVALVGEPTGCRPHVAHKGRFTLRITVDGVPAHASRPDAGVNAIEQMARLFPLLERVADEVKARSHPLLGAASSTLTQIWGGTAPNVVPGSCTLLVDRRLLPGETFEEALAEYDRVLAAARAAAPDLRVTREVEDFALPSETSDPWWVSHLERVAAEVLGFPVSAGGFPATCDMAHLVHQGGIPTAVFGPGDLTLAHQYDEWVPVADLYRAAEVYYRLARRWLEGEHPAP